MSYVKVGFEAELPFWLCMDSKEYGIFIDGKPCQANGKPWSIDLSNDKWLIEMGNMLDGQPMVSILLTADAKKVDEIFPEAPYYHKRKLRTVIAMVFGWPIKENAKPRDAKEKLKNEWDWCWKSFLKSINRFVDIYRTSDTRDKVPTPLGEYEISFNWWYTLLLDDKLIERVRLGLDAYPIIQNPPIKVDQGVQKEISKKLASTYDPLPWKLIFENGRGFHRRGNYRMAVIEIYSGFESFLIDFIRKEYEKKEYEEELIKHLMNITKAHYMLTTGLKLSTGKSFKEIDDDQYKEFIKIRDLRNDIIHGKRTTVLEAESENAIEVINDIIKKISDEV